MVELRENKTYFVGELSVWCVKMELNCDGLSQIDETEWIKRRKHELILRKYRQNTQRLVKEFQMKIQQQSNQIQQLAKEVKRQKFIIDTFTNKTIETLDCHEPQQQIVADSTEYVEAIAQDTEPTTIIYLDAIDVDTLNQGYQNIEVKSEVQPQRYHIKPKINRAIKNESANKKVSLLSIQIQPNLRDSTNVYVCDECNKTMSSRRVLAVRSHGYDEMILFFAPFHYFHFLFSLSIETQAYGALCTKEIHLRSLLQSLLCARWLKKAYANSHW